jgi:hypothetical protein
MMATQIGGAWLATALRNGDAAAMSTLTCSTNRAGYGALAGFLPPIDVLDKKWPVQAI